MVLGVQYSHGYSEAAEQAPTSVHRVGEPWLSRLRRRRASTSGRLPRLRRLRRNGGGASCARHAWACHARGGACVCACVHCGCRGSDADKARTVADHGSACMPPHAHRHACVRARERARVYALCDCAIHTTREVEGAGEDAPHKHTNTQTRTVGRSAGLARRGCGCGCSAVMTIGDFCRWPPCGVHPTAAAAPITHSLTAAKRSA